MMESAINQMDKYDHQRHELSDWLAELELRFQLGGVDTDQSKINWCQLIIGATGSYILAGLEDEASWETAKEALLSRLGLGSMKDEAWAALKNYKRGPKDIVELAVEIEKLSKRLHPHDGEAAEQQAMDTFLNMLERPLVAEVRKLGCHTMESVVSTARHIEKFLAEQADPKKELQMQEKIRLLQKGLEDIRSQIARSLATTATTASPSIQPPPPARHTYQEFAEGAPRRPLGQPPSLCFLCGEEGHLASKCLTLQRLLCQPTPARLLERPSEPKVGQVGCRVGPPITGQLTLEGIPILGLVDTGASVACLGFDIWRHFSAQWGPLRPFEGTVHGVHGKPLQIAGKTQHLDLQWGEARGRACFIVIVGLESPPCLIGMDIMRPLHVHIDVTNGTSTPAQPDLQTVHLNAAQSQQRRQEKPLSQATGPPLAPQPLGGTPSPRASLSPGGTADPSPIQPQRKEMLLSGAGISAPPPQEIPHPAAASPSESPPSAPLPPAPPCTATPHTASCARLLQTADIPPETARLVRCHDPWPAEDVLFCPNDALPAFVTGIPALSSGPELWIAVHNHWPEPLQLHSGQNIGILEVVTLRETPAATSTTSSHPQKPCQPPLSERLSPLQQQQLNELFCEFSDVFSRGEDDLGNTPLLEHAIETHGPPLRQPYRRQNPAVRRKEMAQVQQMLSSNVIRPSNSPWASPVVMVRKKDGSLSFCVDFRQLNAATVKDAHPLPRIDDLLDALHGAKWFSTLDLKSGYWQVPITEQDKAKTTFRTSSGQLFEFNLVPFGLCNSPATFSRLMDRILAGLHWETCLFYLDDIIIFSSTWEEDLARLHQVLERFRHANLKLGADKCTFAAKEVNYLGHRVTEEGLLPDSSLLAAIREIPTPKTPTEVCSFLGLAGYYRRYVKGFAAIAAPLHALTRKDAVFHWSEDCQAAFDCLKTLLTTSPITAFPDFSQAFRLYTDASTAGLGAILAQVRDGKERIICCASRALNQAEKSYPATKLECLAIVWAVAKFRPYLMAMPFEVFTDHYALQWLKTMRTGSALLHHWSAALEEYDFTVHHRSGKVQTHVDRLSRQPVGPAPPEDALLHIQVDTEEEARRLAQELYSVTHLGGQALWKLFSYCYSHKAGRRVCIEVAQSCPQCQLGSDYGHRLKTTGSIQSNGPWDTLSVDIVGPLPADRRHEFLIVFVDCYSRYMILVPANNHTVNTMSNALLRHVVPYFGTSRRLLSDRGCEFVGEVWSKLTGSLGIQRLLTSPYHPEGNSINERSHRTINNMLRARLLDGVPSRTWVDKIPGIMLA